MLISTLSYLEIRRRSARKFNSVKDNSAWSCMLYFSCKKRSFEIVLQIATLKKKGIVFHGDQNSFVIRHPSCLDEGNLKMGLFLGNQRKFNQFLNLRLPFQRCCVPLRSLTFYVMCTVFTGIRARALILFSRFEGGSNSRMGSNSIWALIPKSLF